MAFFRGDFFSPALEMQTSVHVIIPEGTNSNEELRVLYLLHGLSDNCSNWVRNTSIERYAVEYRTAVIIPEVQRSFYTDMENGLQYFTYVTKDLPAFAQKMFGLTGEREKTMIAGLSMGGYGAMKCALSFPENYAFCGAFSSACDMARRVDGERGMGPQFMRDMKAAFGEKLCVPKECDLYYLGEKTAKAEKMPRLFITCGLQDRLLPENREIQKFYKEQGYDVHYEEWEGDHTWEFWDCSIRKAFVHFFGAKEDGVKTPLSDGK